MPRIPSPEGNRVGTQPLSTNSQTISWQCHVIDNYYQSKKRTVVAVEALSRFTLLLPFDFVPTQIELQKRISQQWAYSLVSLMVQHGEISREEEALVFEHIVTQVDNVEWWRNTDLSVNGHVSDAEHWVVQTIADHNIDGLSDEAAFDLAYHINSFSKRAKDQNGKKRQFYPVPHFVDDGLFRFMPDWFGEDFLPAPYSPSKSKLPVKSNVVSLSDYRDGKVK